MAQTLVAQDGIRDPSAFARPDQVTGGTQVCNDVLDGTLRDADLAGNVLHAHARIPGQTEQDMCVIGQKSTMRTAEV